MRKTIRCVGLASGVLALVACSRSSTGGTPEAVPSATEPLPATTSTIASAAPSAVAVVASAAPPVVTSAALPHPSAAAHGSTQPSATPSATAATSAPPLASAVPGPVQYASTSAGGDHFAVAVSARTECPVGMECSGTITLTANGGYHINDEYPYRFLVDASPAVDWLTSDGKGFGKTTGELKKTSATTAEVAFRYRGKQAGAARLSGTYKLSICSEANCQVETVPLAVGITVR